MILANLNIYYTWKNIKSSYNNDEFRFSALNWNDEFDLPDRSYSFLDFQNHFGTLLKNMGS